MLRTKGIPVAFSYGYPFRAKHLPVSFRAKGVSCEAFAWFLKKLRKKLFIKKFFLTNLYIILFGNHLFFGFGNHLFKIKKKNQNQKVKVGGGNINF